MLPGISIWATIIGAILLSIFKPLWMIYVVIVFDVYWVLRVIYFAGYLILSWNRFRVAIRTDWQGKLEKDFPLWRNKKNVIMLPAYNESWEVIAATLDGILASAYPARELTVVVSGEERQAKHWEYLQQKIAENYGGKFADLLLYTHAANLPDEIPGKGSNIHSAEKKFVEYADTKDWRYEDVVVSVFDVDTVVHPQYFSHLNYLYCSHPRPERSSFQPVTLYNNNLWESPAILRIMSFGTSFWMLFSLARLDNLVTFSSHSMSLCAIVDCGGHSKNIVSEDSRIYFQCYLRYDGDYEVTPLYVPVSMDTARGDNWWQSLKNLYFQQRRWAWGAEHIPFLLWEFPRHPRISFWNKFWTLFHEWEGKWSWAVVAILITVLGRLPLWLASPEVRQSALFFNTPYVLEQLMRLAMLGLFVSTIMGMLILPPRPHRQHPYKYLVMIGQWLLLPVSLILFSSLPCIDAVTRLMLGKYLGFNVSAKKRG